MFCTCKNAIDYIKSLLFTKSIEAKKKILSAKLICKESYDAKVKWLDKFKANLAESGFDGSELKVSDFTLDFWNKIGKIDGDNFVSVNAPRDAAYPVFKEAKINKLKAIDAALESAGRGLDVSEGTEASKSIFTGLMSKVKNIFVK